MSIGEHKTQIFFSEKSLGPVVVHGHTVSREAEIKRNRIGVDTGAFATGILTCVVLDGPDISFMTGEDEKT